MPMLPISDEASTNTLILTMLSELLPRPSACGKQLSVLAGGGVIVQDKDEKQEKSVWESPNKVLYQATPHPSLRDIQALFQYKNGPPSTQTLLTMACERFLAMKGLFVTSPLLGQMLPAKMCPCYVGLLAGEGPLRPVAGPPHSGPSTAFNGNPQVASIACLVLVGDLTPDADSGVVHMSSQDTPHNKGTPHAVWSLLEITEFLDLEATIDNEEEEEDNDNDNELAHFFDNNDLEEMDWDQPRSLTPLDLHDKATELRAHTTARRAALLPMPEVPEEVTQHLLLPMEGNPEMWAVYIKLVPPEQHATLLSPQNPLSQPICEGKWVQCLHRHNGHSNNEVIVTFIPQIPKKASRSKCKRPAHPEQQKWAMGQFKVMWGNKVHSISEDEENTNSIKVRQWVKVLSSEQQGIVGHPKDISNGVATVVLQMDNQDTPPLIISLCELTLVYVPGNHVKYRYFDSKGIVLLVDETNSMVTLVERDTNTEYNTHMHAIELCPLAPNFYQFKLGLWVNFCGPNNYKLPKCHGCITVVDDTHTLVIDKCTFMERSPHRKLHHSRPTTLSTLCGVEGSSSLKDHAEGTMGSSRM
ncbi:hypothetical protein EI94DRAFT_1704129 [Lactarius quietus]|nr:hypothetical protein EI94DRAFT_1704129 [Lactarius quietus]